jgi:choice-of-anchor B domain-containing protein
MRARDDHPPLIRAAFALTLAALTACGSSDPESPLTPTSPAPGNSDASLNMVLLSRIDLATLSLPASVDHRALGAKASSAAGNYGYTSPDGRRFALTGLSDGLSIVEVTDPRNPRRVAHIPGAASQWREVRTYRGYVYVTTEARVGLDIIDMRNPSQPRKVRSWSDTFSSAHSLWIDEDRGLLYAHGTRSASGASTGMQVLALEPDPENPRPAGSFGDFYIHDSYGRGTLLYAAAINGGFLAILDVADPSRIREVTRFFTGGRFTHNAWLTDDGRYVFTTDEVPGRPLEGWDLVDPLGDPLPPRKVTEFIATPGSIPHNVMVDGNRLVVSHYTEGVQLLDITNPEQPRRLGFYDTYPGGPGGFNGAWGAYIFPGSNLIVVSDISGGLFVVEYNGP